jgi:hypothetical protein
LALSWLSAAPAHAQSREFDDWVRFPAGSWCEFRTRTESLGEQGRVTNETTTLTRVTVAANDGKTVRLRLESGSVEFSGKRFPTPATEIVLRPHGQSDQEQVAVAELPNEIVGVGEVAY